MRTRTSIVLPIAVSALLPFCRSGTDVSAPPAGALEAAAPASGAAQAQYESERPTPVIRLPTGQPRPWDQQPGSMMPAYSATALDETHVALSELRGRPVLLNFWATWCVPCREEFPELAALQERLGGSGLQVVGVSVDAHLTTAEIAAFTRDNPIGYRVLHDRDNRAEPLFGVPPLPGNFVFDADGRLVYAALGVPEGSLETLTAAAEIVTAPTR